LDLLDQKSACQDLDLPHSESMISLICR
jgi:hypothetical protein